MGLFNFFRREKPPETVHPVFGRIVYQDDDTWENGRAVFPPVQHEVEVIIHAGSDGPGEAHLRYWQELIRRWPELKAAAEPILRASLANWIEEPGRGDIWARLDIEAVAIHAGTPPDEWELTLWCEEASHWPTLVMKGWTPQSCFADG
jgi:hypothetical protein